MEAHIFIAYLGHCLQVTFDCRGVDENWDGRAASLREDFFWTA